MPTIARAEKAVATELDVVTMDLKVVPMDLKVVARTLEVVVFAFTPCRRVAGRTRSIYRKQRCRLGRRHAGLRCREWIADRCKVTAGDHDPVAGRRDGSFGASIPLPEIALRHWVPAQASRSSHLNLAVARPDFRLTQTYHTPSRSHRRSARTALVL